METNNDINNDTITKQSETNGTILKIKGCIITIIPLVIIISGIIYALYVYQEKKKEQYFFLKGILIGVIIKLIMMLVFILSSIILLSITLRPLLLYY